MYITCVQAIPDLKCVQAVLCYVRDWECLLAFQPLPRSKFGHTRLTRARLVGMHQRSCYHHIWSSNSEVFIHPLSLEITLEGGV